jgi:hypothetical protein
MFAPLCFLEKTLQVFLGKTEKAGRATVFSIMASLSIHRFDRALAYDVFSILLVVFVFLIKIKKIKNWGEFAGFVFLLAY